MLTLSVQPNIDESLNSGGGRVLVLVVGWFSFCVVGFVVVVGLGLFCFIFCLVDSFGWISHLF